MRKFVRQNESSIIVFGAYVRGKTQELIRFLNIECGIAPIVSAKAAKVCSYYEKCGVSLDYIEVGSSEAEEQMRSSFVAIMPQSMVNFSFGAQLSSAFGHDVKTAVATGWAAISRFPVDAAFPFSDHADFKQTMQYIYQSGAKKVICANANEEEAAAYLRRLGINATTKKGCGKEVQATLAASWQ
jgi:Cft2 family RNA processing exonuclease